MTAQENIKKSDYKLSIIVPVYNVSKYLPDCLNSLLAQGLLEDEYEIICVNDGSTDNSLEILKEYQKKHPQIVIVSKENGGGSSARNVALSLVKGKFVCFVDSDDCIRSGSFARILQYMLDNDVSYLKYEFLPVHEDYTFSEESPENFNFTFLGKNFLPTRAMWSYFIESNILEKHHLTLDEKMVYAEDTLFNYQLSLACYFEKKNTAQLDFQIYKYRTNPTSLMHQNKIKRMPKHYLSMEHFSFFYRDQIQKLIDMGADEFLIENTKLRLGATVTSMLYDNLYIHKHSPKEIFKMLKNENLYPFPSQAWAIKSAKTKKLKLLKTMEYLFRYPFFYHVFYGLSKLKK